MPGWKLEKVLPTITEKCVKYISERAKAKANQPFFLYFAMTSPHTPIAPSKPFQGKSGVSAYADFVMETDWSVGQVVNAIDRAGLADNTLLVFSADNGTSPRAQFDELESKGVYLRQQFRGWKADIYEGGHRVPFVARWPGTIEPNTSSNEPICLTDFMATAADVTKFKLPDDAAEDSQSILPLLKGEPQEAPLKATVVNHSISGHFAIRNGKWKLCFSRGAAGWSLPKEAEAKKAEAPVLQLFDLDLDPREQHNIQAEHPNVVKKMTALLKKVVVAGRSRPGPRQPNDTGVWWKELPWAQDQQNQPDH